MLGFSREASSGEELSLKNYAISARASPKIIKKIDRGTSFQGEHILFVYQGQNPEEQFCLLEKYRIFHPETSS